VYRVTGHISQQHDVLKHVMDALPAASKAVYEVQNLDKFDSRRLFNVHAFMSETPREGFNLLNWQR
jgi:hypothetical protein